MPEANKLRVALPDMSEALNVVASEIHDATGFVAEPVYQEIDGRELVIEVALEASTTAGAVELARAIGHAAPDIEVLSAWKEVPPTSQPLASAPAAAVFEALGPEGMPDLARRSLNDGVPTARWMTRDESGEGDPACWLLAVPLLRPERTPLVGMHWRCGHTLRFSAAEAAAILAGLDKAS